MNGTIYSKIECIQCIHSVLCIEIPVQSNQLSFCHVHFVHVLSCILSKYFKFKCATEYVIHTTACQTYVLTFLTNIELMYIYLNSYGQRNGRFHSIHLLHFICVLIIASITFRAEIYIIDPLSLAHIN